MKKNNQNVIKGPWKKKPFFFILSANDWFFLMSISIVFVLFIYVLFAIALGMVLAYPFVQVAKRIPTKLIEKPPVLTPQMIALINFNVVQLHPKRKNIPKNSC
jgi:hypothetical protein